MALLLGGTAGKWPETSAAAAERVWVGRGVAWWGALKTLKKD